MQYLQKKMIKLKLQKVLLNFKLNKIKMINIFLCKLKKQNCYHKFEQQKVPTTQN